MRTLAQRRGRERGTGEITVLVVLQALGGVIPFMLLFGKRIAMEDTTAILERNGGAKDKSKAAAEPCLLSSTCFALTIAITSETRRIFRSEA